MVDKTVARDFNFPDWVCIKVWRAEEQTRADQSKPKESREIAGMTESRKKSRLMTVRRASDHRALPTGTLAPSSLLLPGPP